MKIKFLGAAQTVTGSKTLLEIGQTQVLVDSGMYQGSKDISALNFKELDLDIKNIKYIFLTHAHFDHCGYLPVLIKEGFQGKIICSKLTMQLAQVILKDSAKVQQYDLNDKKIDQVLYDEYDVERTMSFFETKNIDKKYQLEDFNFQLYEAGHILGATSIVFSYKGQSICFSGDIGRQGDLIHKQPNLPRDIDYLVMESTYGDREHQENNASEILSENIKRIKGTKGVLLIPAFAVARTQVIIQELYNLFEELPELKLPVYVDSPMGVKVSRIYAENSKHLKIEDELFKNALDSVKLLEFGNDFKKMTRAKGPMIIISSSGMISGGKVLKYFDMYAKHEMNTILISGYQSAGTIGRRILDGDLNITLFGHTINVRAKVDKLSSMSAHADRVEMKNLILESGKELKKIYLNHGEKTSLDDFKKYLENESGINVEIADKNTEYELGE